MDARRKFDTGQGGRPARQSVALREQLSKRLIAYELPVAPGIDARSLLSACSPLTVCLVTGAAGLGLLAAAPAEADIITSHVAESFDFRPAATNSYRVLIPVDLNNDGVNDFELRGVGGQFNSGANAALSFVGFGGAGALDKAAALPKGTPIGPTGSFESVANMVHGFVNNYRPSASVGGAWAGTVSKNGQYGHVNDAYLGLTFDINGQVHFGWAELINVTTVAGGGDVEISGELVAYAYDTVADQSIEAGQTSTAAPEPGTLGLLALGSLGLGFWRRKKQEAVTSDECHPTAVS